LVELLKARNVALPAPSISSRHSILTSLGYIDIAVEELKPRYLGGYGAVPQALVPELNRSAEEVQATAKEAILVLKDATKGAEKDVPEAGVS
jgi:hypothetical protein